jgi:hypothetical protein
LIYVHLVLLITTDNLTGPGWKSLVLFAYLLATCFCAGVYQIGEDQARS